MSRQAKQLINQMTLKEKASLCSGKDFWNLKGIARLNLPEIMVTDGPHGLRKQKGDGDHVGLASSEKATCFPTASLLASTWDLDLIHQVGVALGEECLTENVSVLLGPGANIKRHPLCGRNFEYFSEDPLLSGEIASAWINGVQSQGVGSSLKHYVANNQETMRMVVDTIVDERTLRELYLKSFEIPVKKAQPWTVMCSYNKVNGTYLSEHHTLLQKVLKEEWKHEGLVVTDWGATNHRSLGVIAGNELEMPYSGPYNDRAILHAIEEGTLQEEVLNDRVERVVDLILNAQQTLEKDSFTYDQQEHHKLARQVAAEGMVLLKNDNHILPLDTTKKVALIGGFATKPRYQGSGSSLINPHNITTALDAFKEKLGPQLLHATGYLTTTDQVDQPLMDEAMNVAKDADVIVVMAGLTDSYESEGFDREHLNLPQNHNVLIDALLQLQKPLIVTLSNGAPVLMPWKDRVDAIVEQYLGGEASGEALRDVLFGDINPSGKLAETFPQNIDEFPSNQHFPGLSRQVQYREGLYVGYRAYDSMNLTPLYPFGYGLSYSTFTFSNFNITQKENDVILSLDITNTSDIAGKETIQVYVSKPSSDVYRPMQELKGFKKVFVNSKETVSTTITIPLQTLSIFNAGSFKLERGEYIFHLGTSSRDILYSQLLSIESMDTIVPDHLQAYTTIDQSFNPSVEEFKQLYGKDIPPLSPSKPYNFTSTFGELQHTFVGKQLGKVIRKQLVEVVGEVDSETTKKMLDQMLEELPMKSLVMLSGGKLSHRRGQGLLDLMNKKPLRGLWNLIRG